MDAWIQPHFESKAAFFFFFWLHFPFLLFPRGPLTVWWNWSGCPFPLLLLQLWAHVSAQSHRGGRRYSAFRSAHKARPNKRSIAEKSGCGGASADLWVTRRKQTGLLLTSTILPSRNKSSRYFYQQKMSRSWGQNKDGSVQAPDLGINNSPQDRWSVARVRSLENIYCVWHILFLSLPLPCILQANVAEPA